MAIEKASGVAIRIVDYSETSQIATFLTDRFGKLSAIAKGAKRAASATGGALDLLTLNEIVFSTSASGNLAILREARTLEQFPGIRATPAHYYAALYFAELSGIFGEGSEGSSAHFDLLASALRALSRADEGAIPNLVSYFESHTLIAGGLAPNLAECARCGRKIEPSAAARVSVLDGGILCASCTGGVGIGRGSLAALKRVFQSTLQGATRLRLRRDIQSDVSGLLAALVVHNARHVPKLMKYVRRGFQAALRRWMGAGAPGEST